MAESADEGDGKPQTQQPASEFSISKDQIESLPSGGFDGDISLIETWEKAEWAARVLRKRRVLGFDTETRPSFRKGESHPTALIQLATEKYAFLFRLNCTGMTPGLRALLEDASVLKVGQGLKYELRLLEKEHRVRGRGFVDLLEAAHRHNFTPKNVKGMAAMFLGIRISKAAQTSNWENRCLSAKQVCYAATDAWACLMIYRKIAELRLALPKPGMLR